MGVGAILALAPISGVTLRVCEYKDRIAMLAHHGRAMLARGPHRGGCFLERGTAVVRRVLSAESLWVLGLVPRGILFD